MSHRQVAGHVFSTDTAGPGFSLYPSADNATNSRLDSSCDFSYTDKDLAESQRDFGCLRGVLWALTILALPYALLIWWAWPTKG